MSNSVFIATSLDGYIADRNGELDWLDSVPNPDGIDMGFTEQMDKVDALLMGRNTYTAVIGFDIPWPYSKPVFVLSTSITCVPEELEDKVFIVKGPIKQVISDIHQLGHKNLYLDGGQVIQQCLQADLVDEMVITQIPILLGAGSPLFGALSSHTHLKLVESKVYLDAIVQSRYQRAST